MAKISDDDPPALTRDQTLKMLRGDSTSRRRWNQLFGVSSEIHLDLSGASLRGLDLRGLRSLAYVKLDRADLRKTKLDCLSEGNKGANLDGASFTFGTLYAIDCSMKGIHIEDPAFVDVSGSDLTGATLAGWHNVGFQYKKSILRGAKLGKWSFIQANLEGADLRGVDLRGLEFREAKARGANFVRANLAKATFLKADVRGADFSGADLTGADFTGANLKGAKVDGATLTDSVFTQANLAGVDTRKAKGFALPENPFVAGPCIKKLEKLAAKAKQLESKIRVDLKKGYVTLNVHSYGRGKWTVRGWRATVHYGWSPQGVPGAAYGGNYTYSMAESFSVVVGRWLKGRMRPDSVQVKSKVSPISGKQLKELFLGAWREALGARAADTADAAAGKVAPTGNERAAALLDLLRGKGGVKKWNARSLAERTPAGGFRGTDLSNAELAGVDFCDLDFQKAKLDGADLTAAGLVNCKLRGATFRGARLARAEFKDTDLRKVDFTDAKLAGAGLEGAIFDATTILPAGFRAPKDMVWKGKSADPRVVTRIAAGAPKVIDAGGLMKRLAGQTDKSRFEKALKMLKADRFKLFVEVNDDRLAGVVKSQSDAELVYACSLAADGGYACCSQNLNPCGGLRGALCKHLLVLVIGLVKRGEIDPTRVDGWIRAASGRAPALEKDAMTRVLLRFKGAEAGQIDWRPMETVPEDYYAM